MSKTIAVQWVFCLAAFITFFSGFKGDPTICAILAGVFAAFLVREFSAAWHTEKLESAIAELKTEVLATRAELSTIKATLTTNQRDVQQTDEVADGR